MCIAGFFRFGGRNQFGGRIGAADAVAAGGGAEKNACSTVRARARSCAADPGERKAVSGKAPAPARPGAGRRLRRSELVGAGDDEIAVGARLRLLQIGEGVGAVLDQRQVVGVANARPPSVLADAEKVGWSSRP